MDGEEEQPRQGAESRWRWGVLSFQDKEYVILGWSHTGVGREQLVPLFNHLLKTHCATWAGPQAGNILGSRGAQE